MTRDELVADLVDSAGSAPWPDGVRSVVEAVLARLEALGWRQVGEPAAYELSGRQIGTTWPEGATAALITRELLDSMVAEINAARAADYRADWEQAARDALLWREAAEKATEDLTHWRQVAYGRGRERDHLRRELTARGLERVAYGMVNGERVEFPMDPLPLGGPGQGTEAPE